jgi:hypothetical protein
MMGFSEGDLAQKYYTISRRRYKEILVRSPFDGGELARLDEDAFRNGGDQLYKQEVSSVAADNGQRNAGDGQGAADNGKRAAGDGRVAADNGQGHADGGNEDAAKSTETLRKTMAGYALLKKHHAPKSAVDWALRYVLSFPFVVTCVASSGDPAHAEEDMEAAERFRPLTEEDRGRLKSAAEKTSALPK